MPGTPPAVAGCRPRRAGPSPGSGRTPPTLLRAAGWRVTDARADRSVADVWADLGGPVGSVAGSGREPLGVPG